MSRLQCTGHRSTSPNRHSNGSYTNPVVARCSRLEARRTPPLADLAHGKSTVSHPQRAAGCKRVPIEAGQARYTDQPPPPKARQWCSADQYAPRRCRSNCRRHAVSHRSTDEQQAVRNDLPRDPCGRHIPGNARSSEKAAQRLNRGGAAPNGRGTEQMGMIHANGRCFGAGTPGRPLARPDSRKGASRCRTSRADDALQPAPPGPFQCGTGPPR